MKKINAILKYINKHKKQVAIGVSSLLLLLLLVLYFGTVQKKYVRSGLSEEEIIALKANPEALMSAGIDTELEPTAIEKQLSLKLASQTKTEEDSDESQDENRNEKQDEDKQYEVCDDDSDEYSNLAIAKVDKYVNVRSEPNTGSAVVGKMYDGAVAQILDTTDGEDGEWFKVISGEVEGYIKSEFFIYGDEVASKIDDYIILMAGVNCDRLNVRQKPDIKSERIGYALYGESFKLIEKSDEWTKIEYTEGKTGYVATEYIKIEESFVYAKSVKEEEEAKKQEEVRNERQEETEEASPEVTETTVATPPATTTYSTNSELRNLIVNYALSYVGHRYVHGGQSLATGTDCSGFTSLILKEFGVSVSRTPQGQYTGAGRAISEEELQPGDIVCYTQNGSTCSHVGFYIGNGQIVHAANSRKGVIVSNLHYIKTLGYRNVID